MYNFGRKIDRRDDAVVKLAFTRIQNSRLVELQGQSLAPRSRMFFFIFHRRISISNTAVHIIYLGIFEVTMMV